MLYSLKQIYSSGKANKQRRLLRRKILNARELKIVIGAGNTNYDGWIKTDVQELDITDPKHWGYYFSKDAINNLLAEHVFEHLNYHQIRSSLLLAKEYMKKGGVLRIAVPDANHPSHYVYDLTKPGGKEAGADDHKIFFDVEIVKRLANDLSFGLELIEYFDKDGVFHRAEYDFKNGYVKRCSKNYVGRFTNSESELEKFYDSIPPNNLEQIKSLGITYTSLLFDYIKK